MEKELNNTINSMITAIHNRVMEDDFCCDYCIGKPICDSYVNTLSCTATILQHMSMIADKKYNS